MFSVFSMFRKGLIVCAAAVLLMASFGCACMNAAVPAPTVSPTATLMPTSAPSPTAEAPLTEQPNLSASPGIGGAVMEGIENFKEGTEVKEAEVPAVVKAIREKHGDAAIVSIRHAMQQDRQVYAVEIELDGKVETVYVGPDGKLTDTAAGAESSKP